MKKSLFAILASAAAFTAFSCGNGISDTPATETAARTPSIAVWSYAKAKGEEPAGWKSTWLLNGNERSIACYGHILDFLNEKHYPYRVTREIRDDGDEEIYRVRSSYPDEQLFVYYKLVHHWYKDDVIIIADNSVFTFKQWEDWGWARH